MSNNIFNDLVQELLEGINLKNISNEKKDKLIEIIIDNLYHRIILKSIELVDKTKKNDLINELQVVKNSADDVMGVLQGYVPNIENIIAQTMDEYKKKLNNGTFDSL